MTQAVFRFYGHEESTASNTTLPLYGPTRVISDVTAAESAKRMFWALLCIWASPLLLLDRFGQGLAVQLIQAYSSAWVLRAGVACVRLGRASLHVSIKSISFIRGTQHSFLPIQITYRCLDLRRLPLDSTMRNSWPLASNVQLPSASWSTSCPSNASIVANHSVGIISCHRVIIATSTMRANIIE